MTVRVSPPAAINDPTSPYRPHLKAAHRADPEITISPGRTRRIEPRGGAALHHWHPADVLHFPFRSHEQWENKGVRRARGDKPLGQYVTALRAKEAGRSAERYRSLVVDDASFSRDWRRGRCVWTRGCATRCASGCVASGGAGSGERHLRQRRSTRGGHRAVAALPRRHGRTTRRPRGRIGSRAVTIALDDRGR